MLFVKIAVVFNDKRTEHVNTQCGQHAEYIACGTYSYHCILTVGTPLCDVSVFV